MNASEWYQEEVNIGSGNGLVPPGAKTITCANTDPDKCRCMLTRSQWVKNDLLKNDHSFGAKFVVTGGDRVTVMANFGTASDGKSCHHGFQNISLNSAHSEPS